MALQLPAAPQELSAAASPVLTLDCVAGNTFLIAKLPSVPRQILKDIPRPPNSASRDD